MEKKELHISYLVCAETELPEADRTLLEAARRATQTSYAPYSHFCVGAALRLASGEMVCGSNQENAAFPSGTCAERCTVFYAQAQYPTEKFDTLAIAARNSRGGFTPSPITPCGACRQVLAEVEKRQGSPLRLLLYGERCVYIVPDVASLLPFSFDDGSMTE